MPHLQVTIWRKIGWDRRQGPLADDGVVADTMTVLSSAFHCVRLNDETVVHQERQQWVHPNQGSALRSSPTFSIGTFLRLSPAVRAAPFAARLRGHSHVKPAPQRVGIPLPSTLNFLPKREDRSARTTMRCASSRPALHLAPLHSMNSSH
jgi:hypothetical protein